MSTPMEFKLTPYNADNPSEDQMGFTEIIKAVMKEHKISNGEAARRCDTPKPRVPKMLKCENQSEAVFRRTLDDLGFDVEIKITQRPGTEVKPPEPKPKKEKSEKPKRSAKADKAVKDRAAKVAGATKPKSNGPSSTVKSNKK